MLALRMGKVNENREKSLFCISCSDIDHNGVLRINDQKYRIVMPHNVSTRWCLQSSTPPTESPVH